MDVTTFLRALRRSWLVALLLFEAAIFGGIVYVDQTILPTAEATAAVRDPLTIRPAQYQAAQITFDAIVSSRLLAEAVADDLNTTPKLVEDSLSVDVIVPASGINISPLYVVSGEGETDAAALNLVRSAVTRAEDLYAELNVLDRDDVGSTLAAEQEDSERQLTEATLAYEAFLAKNDADNLQQRITAARTQVNRLNDRVSQTSADVAGADQTNNPTALAVAEERLEEFERQLIAAETDLANLEALEPEHRQLTQQLAVAENLDVQFEDLERSLILGQLLPLDSQVKILDEARIEPQSLMTILVYALATILGIMAAITAVYIQALREQSRETVATVVEVVGAPVLARFPAGALAGVGGRR